jgi:signal transduction histidine kinase
MSHDPNTPAPPLVAGQALAVEERPHPEGPEVNRECLDELLGTVAHELRGPLATLLTGVSVLASTCELDPLARQTLPVMEGQLRQAIRLVDDLFDLCAGGLGKLSLSKEVVALADVVSAAIEASGPVLAVRHRLTVALPSEPLPLEADPLRLAQVLTNLLNNAAKFTEPGGDVRLSVTACGGQVVLRVKDNGRGMAPESLSRVFELFHQVPGSCRKAGGLGVGLALVKSLVELHGGTVAAYSDGPGTGSEFVVRLPAAGCAC